MDYKEYEKEFAKSIEEDFYKDRLDKVLSKFEQSKSNPRYYHLDVNGLLFIDYLIFSTIHLFFFSTFFFPNNFKRKNFILVQVIVKVAMIAAKKPSIGDEFKISLDTVESLLKDLEVEQNEMS